MSGGVLLASPVRPKREGLHANARVLLGFLIHSPWRDAVTLVAYTASADRCLSPAVQNTHRYSLGLLNGMCAAGEPILCWNVEISVEVRDQELVA
jgi:hypothetical protein